MSQEHTSLDGKIAAFLRELWDLAREPAYTSIDILALIGLVVAENHHVPQWIIVPPVIVYIGTRRLWQRERS